MSSQTGDARSLVFWILLLVVALMLGILVSGQVLLKHAAVKPDAAHPVAVVAHGQTYYLSQAAGTYCQNQGRIWLGLAALILVIRSLASWRGPAK